MTHHPFSLCIVMHVCVMVCAIVDVLTMNNTMATQCDGEQMLLKEVCI